MNKWINKQMNQSIHQSINTWVIPKVSALDILDNSIFHNLYISETYSFTDAVNCLYLMPVSYTHLTLPTNREV